MKEKIKMKKNELQTTLKTLLSQMKSLGEDRLTSEASKLEPSVLAHKDNHVSSIEARKQIKEMVDQLADLADAGDRGCQAILVEFFHTGKFLLKTASPEPGKPCKDCGKIH